jgi:hypothetical protein
MTKEQLEGELKQAQEDAEHWRQIATSFEFLSDEWARSCRSWMKMYEDVLRAKELLEATSADVAEGSEFHQWFLRNQGP